jgi:hypothetical protein
MEELAKASKRHIKEEAALRQGGLKSNQEIQHLVRGVTATVCFSEVRLLI